MKLNIGFSFNLGNAGPSNFLNNLKRAFSKNKIAKTSYFLSPFSDCNIYSNAVRNPWNKPYIFRVDGIGYDKSRSKEHLKAMNNMIIDGINENGYLTTPLEDIIESIDIEDIEVEE